MTKLVLDPMCVLSAWEKIGGSAFSSDDVHLDDPAAVTLDLSSWEARLKPFCAPATSHSDTNIFASLFTPAEMGLSFLPSCCTQPTGAAVSESPQVVPMCPSMSAGSFDDAIDNTVGLADHSMVDDAGIGNEEGAMSIHFSDMEALISASPSSSSEAGVVPDFNASLHLQHHQLHGSTSTSGDTCLAAAATTAAVPALAAPTANNTASFFVPVSQPQSGVSRKSCNAPVCKQEPVVGGDHEPQQQTVPETQHVQPQQMQPPHPASSLLASVPGSQKARQPAVQQAQQAPPTRAQASNAAPSSSAPGPQFQQTGGPAVYIRTRAECLERYRQKKARRLYTKKIRYQLRKINADKRPRIKGRFVKKEELADYLASQRGYGVALGEECDEVYFGDAMMDSDEE